MKKQIATFILGFVFCAYSAQTVREVHFKTEKKGEVVHWSPEVVKVKPGEKIKFIVEHDLEGGFNIHGFTIVPLKISKQVDRNQKIEVETTIPAKAKAGTQYPITCQFHPKHVGATLIVE